MRGETSDIIKMSDAIGVLYDLKKNYAAVSTIHQNQFPFQQTAQNFHITRKFYVFFYNYARGGGGSAQLVVIILIIFIFIFIFNFFFFFQHARLR